ncbi:SDR family NAD(P)-dependent oxidoreductase [Salipiger sp. 1_MG-2023]|uniref:SDR family NAD(P)-dependent oxidoreductase n=1 Tax=Salipiger sp. 1_MG-2023 TaxID=3062665 RepID=UPI0034C66EC3
MCARHGGCRSFAPHVGSRQRRRAVSSTSRRCFRPALPKGVSLYTISKAMILHLKAGHVLEWAKHGIRVNAPYPGYIRTSINDAFWETDQGCAEPAKLPARA